MLLRSSFAARDCGDASARGGRNEDLEKLYQKRPIWGGTAIRNGRWFPRWRGGLVAENPGTRTQCFTQDKQDGVGRGFASATFDLASSGTRNSSRPPPDPIRNLRSPDPETLTLALSQGERGWSGVNQK